MPASKCKNQSALIPLADIKPRFEYLRPKSISETLKLLNQFKGQAAILAGGTDLIVKMRLGKVIPQALIDIKGIAELSGVKSTAKQVLIGPLTTITEIATDPILKKVLPVLPRTALLMASPQVRNRGTIGGNICNAAPSADMAPPLLVLGTKIKYATRTGTKTVNLEDFFKGPSQTILGNKDLVTAFIIPVLQTGTRVGFRTLTLREAMDLSVVSAAAFVRKEHGIIKEARIALGAVAPIPLRAKAAEKRLIGTTGQTEHIQAASAAAASECRPISDVRASEKYRCEMVRVVTRRVLEEILK